MKSAASAKSAANTNQLQNAKSAAKFCAFVAADLKIWQ
jgi:hypothetical protein